MLLLLSVPATLFTERLIHIAMDKAAGGYAYHRDVCTRIVDNSWFLLGFQLFASGVAIIPALNKFSPGEIVAFLAGLRSEIPAFGWPLTFLVVVNLTAPLIVGGCLLRAYLKYGKRRKELGLA